MVIFLKVRGLMLYLTIPDRLLAAMLVMVRLS